jgi:hypothetical protein
MAHQAIRTRYVGPTNVKGSRIIAKCEAASVRVSYDDGLNVEENHRAAMLALRERMGWNGPDDTDMIPGVFDGDWYWVFLPKQ